MASARRTRKDFVAVALAYANEAIRPECKTVGKWIRLAAHRFLKDLERANGDGGPFYFDPWHANDACDFIEKLHHVEGEWELPTIVLHPAQVFFIVQLFGFRKPDGRRRFTTAMLAVARKAAKALAIDTPIPTPSGWTTMGDLAVGDQVFGANGKPCTVKAISRFYKDHDCYRLGFSNGESVVADAGHQWLTTACVDAPGSGRKAPRAKGVERHTRVRTTKEIAETLRYSARQDVNHSVAMPKPLECEEAALPIAPYSFGAWLGDGHSSQPRITCHRDDIEIIENIRADGWQVVDRYSNGSAAATYCISDGSRWTRTNFQSILKNMGVFGNKHIPAVYLRASREQRIALLQGLMDTDGTSQPNGEGLSYTTTRKDLSEGFCELLASLGIKHSIRASGMRCNGRVVSGTAYRISFCVFRDDVPAFRLKRKLDRMKWSGQNTVAARSRTVQIVSAERVPSVPVKCITVDSPDSLFLFGRTMLPTHNSTLLASVALYIYCCEQQIGPQVITAATTGDQAKIIFEIARKMVLKSPALQDAFGLQPFAKSIVCGANGGSFKYISAKASTQDGLNPSVSLLDEIHAHTTHDLLNVLKTAAGARKSPFFGYATTEGYANQGPWHELRHFSKLVLEGITEADHFLTLYFAVDDKDDEFDESCWIKANPLLYSNPILLDEIRKEAIEAKQMPGRLGEFRIKRLNRPAAAAGAWIDIPKWRRCGGKLPMDKLRTAPCFGGLDLASTSDMTAFRLVWLLNGEWYTWGIYWVPAEASSQRTQRGGTVYDAWIKSGYIIETEGNVTDYSVIEETIYDALSRFNVTCIAYDNWNATDLISRLQKRNVKLVNFDQTAKMYHPPMQALERAYTSGKFHHGDNPVLNFNAANIVAKRDQNLNMAPDRRKSADKIDGMCALLMGMGLALTAPEPIKPRVYSL